MKQRRLSNKELRQLDEVIPIKIGKGREVFELDHPKGKVYIIEGLPAFFEYEGKLYPTLQFLLDVGLDAPAVYVDKGAIPYVAKGADVMRPGIQHVEGDFKKHDLVIVRDGKHGQPLAVGLSHLNKEALVESKKGKMIKVIHHINDWIWRLKPTRGASR